MTASPQIYSTHPLHPRAMEMLRCAGAFRVATAHDAATLAREGREADVVIVRVPVPEAMFADAPRLRAAIRHGAGMDMVPMQAATRSGVLVANTPGVNARTVAEHVMMMALSLCRRSRQIDLALRSEGWHAGRAQTDLASDLAGKVLGVIGMGDIGREVAGIARRGFGLEVVTATRRPGTVPEGVRALALADLAAIADIVAVCCPLTPETRGLVGAEFIGRMRPGGFVINIARGAVIDDDALIAALSAGRIGGAALDVFVEQPLRPDHPYLGFDNVIVTPHAAGVTDDSLMRMATGAAAEALRVLAGDLPVNLRNPEAVPLYRSRFGA